MVDVDSSLSPQNSAEGATAPPDASANAAMLAQMKYQTEKEKRVRSDGSKQFTDLKSSTRFKHLQDDIWTKDTTQVLEDGKSYEYLIKGAGFGGIIAAVRLIQAGVNVDDIWFVDSAGGFGGTWYWNRYPGLMCDVESYIYLPLLEEMGYMPKHKYSSGLEILTYIDSIVEKYKLKPQAQFHTGVKGMTWNENTKSWTVNMTSTAGHESKITARFVVLASGVLNYPQIPHVAGIEDYEGKIFHTSRFDYKSTGGSQEDPSLINLKNKTVGVIGTGATAIQVIPELAKWAKKVYVFQRTPSSIAVRGQKVTDADEWAKIASKKGWQQERNENFNKNVQHWPDKPATNLVNDGWTEWTTAKALLGGLNHIKGLADVPAYIGQLRDVDIGRQEGIRQRVDSIVEDKVTAEKLKAWYPSWCKRPCFHDEYLSAFNKENVELIDTDGKGISSMTKDSVVVAGTDHPIDILILATGFKSPAEAGSPAARAVMTITGRDGTDLETKWNTHWSSLHGRMSHDFPNMFFMHNTQGGACANYTYIIDHMAQELAHIITQATKNTLGKVGTIEVTFQAEQDWTKQVLMRAPAFAAMAGCTPGYYNNEGATDKIPPEARMTLARHTSWVHGMEDYLRVVRDWMSNGQLSGIEVQSL